MSERYIVIQGWEKFQHRDAGRRSAGSPLWIKNYPSLLHKDEYRNLSGHQRAILHGLWLEYASARAQIILSTVSLSRRLNLRVTMKHLDALSHAGFITFSASSPASNLMAEMPAKKRREEKRTLSRDVSRDFEPKSGTEWEGQREKELEQEKQERGNGWVDNLSSYTGCRIIRGEVGISHKYDPLGTEPKPAGWPHATPTKAEILKALKERSFA